MSHELDSPLLDEALAAFVQRFVSINVATRDPHNVPTLARAVGCRVSPDHRRVTVFLPVRRAAAVLDNVRANQAIAVVFSQPSTHQTIQLKGCDASVGPLLPGDHAVMADYLESFAAELLEIGHAEEFARCVGSDGSDDIAAVTFTPTAAFQQTPGPGAGRQLAK